MTVSNSLELVMIMFLMLGIGFAGAVGEWAVKHNRRWLAVAIMFPAYLLSAVWLGFCIYAGAFLLPETVKIVIQHLRHLNDSQLDIIRDSAALAILGCLAVYYASQGLLFAFEKFPRFAAFFFGVLFFGSSEASLRYGLSESAIQVPEFFYAFHILMILFSLWCLLVAFGRIPAIPERVRVWINLKQTAKA